MLSPHFPQPPPCFKLWPSQPLNLSEVRSQGGQGAFIRSLKVKRKKGWVGKKQRVPVDDGGLPRQDGHHSGGRYGQDRGDRGDDVITGPSEQGEKLLNSYRG